jgi:hypothetical protein
MKLSDFYPNPKVLIASELKILNFLRTDSFITERHSQFAQDAGMYYGRNKQDFSRFEFFSYFDIAHAAMHGQKGMRRSQRNLKPNLRLTLAALIGLKNGSYSNVTYCLSVCRLRSLSILRKFHFDITVSDDTSNPRSQQHPQCHLQYCGKMLPQMTEMGCRPTQLDPLYPRLSEPRIFFGPMSLALLIDMALHEFPDDRSKKFRASSEWQNLVRSQETLVLQPFYNKCLDVIGKKRTLADEFYID